MNRWVPIAGGILLNLALGAFYAWSVFILPLEREFGWSREQTSWVFTIAVISTAASFVLGGRIQDTRGPRVCAVLGGSLVAAGFGLASFTTTLPFLYGAFGIVVGLGNGIGYAAPTPVASKWFPDRRGLVIGLTVAGYGASSAITGPVATALIDSIGWRWTFRVLGAVFLVMALVASALLKNPPAGHRAPALSPSARRRQPVNDMTTGQMVRTRTFYGLWIAYCLGATAGLMTISQLVPFARGAGLSAAAATFALTVGAVGNAGGRIMSGWLSDTFGRLATLRIMMLGSALFMPALFVWRTDLVLFYVLVAAVYWCYGTLLSVFASTTADLYGTRHLGLNYGVLFTAWGTAGVLGPLIGARVFDAFGDYRYAFYVASALAVLAFASLWVARAPGAPSPDALLAATARA
ncbi:MAG: OFA family MFS transporter [Acidobacteria bacterium]|nr:OFA family MFS transporter [Acidobacteriota bacterium]